MLITIKTLKQQSFTVDFDILKTVKELKQIIQFGHSNEFPIENQTLIYSGMILDDERTLQSYEFDNKKFIVLMVKRPGASEKTETASVKSEGENSSNDQKARSDNKIKPGTASSAGDAIGSPEPLSTDNTSNVENSDNNVRQTLMEMGYNSEMTEEALLVSNNNLERAIEYLLSETSNLVNPDDSRQTVGQNELNAGSVANERLSNENDPLNFLRTQPQFQEMRSIVRQNPDLLNVILQQIAQTNPALLQLISENQDSFLNLFNEPFETGQNVNMNNPGETNSPIAISTEDREAIERLKALGFPEHLVIQAYFACDKNENLAANILLSNEFSD